MRRFAILLVFDFIVAIKKRSTHQRANHISRITSGKEPTRINDDLLNASLFRVEIVPKWSELVVHFLTTRTLKDIEDSL